MQKFLIIMAVVVPLVLVYPMIVGIIFKKATKKCEKVWCKHNPKYNGTKNGNCGRCEEEHFMAIIWPIGLPIKGLMFFIVLPFINLIKMCYQLGTEV